MEWGADAGVATQTNYINTVSRRRVRKFILCLMDFIDFIKNLWYNIYTKDKERKKKTFGDWILTVRPVQINAYQQAQVSQS